MRARFVEADVRSGEDVQGMFAVADEAWGRVDVIYNNAGVGGPEGRVTECSEERYDLISDINIRGVWLGMKYGIPHLERAGGGSIIVTAFDCGDHRRCWGVGLLRLEGRRGRHGSGSRGRVGLEEHPHQLHTAGQHRDRPGNTQRGAD